MANTVIVDETTFPKFTTSPDIVTIFLTLSTSALWLTTRKSTFGVGVGVGVVV